MQGSTHLQVIMDSLWIRMPSQAKVKWTDTSQSLILLDWCYIYVSERVSLGLDNGLLPFRHQAIIQTNTDQSTIGYNKINSTEPTSVNILFFIIHKNNLDVIVYRAIVCPGK